jgi:hypothetical protein
MTGEMSEKEDGFRIAEGAQQAVINNNNKIGLFILF